MNRRTIFVIGVTAGFFIIYNMSTPSDLYSQQEGMQAKGIKAFPGEMGKAKDESIKSAKGGPEKKYTTKPVKRRDSPKGGESSLRQKNKELEARIKESAAKAKEDSSKLYFELGNAYTKAKLYKNAIDAYLLSLEANPQCAEAHYNLGLLYQRYQGDTDKAAIHLKKYLSSNPPPDRKREVQYLLGMLRSGREWVTAYY